MWLDTISPFWVLMWLYTISPFWVLMWLDTISPFWVLMWLDTIFHHLPQFSSFELTRQLFFAISNLVRVNERLFADLSEAVGFSIAPSHVTSQVVAGLWAWRGGFFWAEQRHTAVSTSCIYHRLHRLFAIRDISSFCCSESLAVSKKKTQCAWANSLTRLFTFSNLKSINNWGNQKTAFFFCVHRTVTSSCLPKP